MRDLAMYMSACFMLAGLVGIALLVMEFAIRALQEHYALIDAVTAEPPRVFPAVRNRHAWGIEPGANPYAEYSVKGSPKG